MSTISELRGSPQLFHICQLVSYPVILCEHIFCGRRFWSMPCLGLCCLLFAKLTNIRPATFQHLNSKHAHAAPRLLSNKIEGNDTPSDHGGAKSNSNKLIVIANGGPTSECRGSLGTFNSRRTTYDTPTARGATEKRLETANFG